MLAPAKKKYSQLFKEGLAIVFGVERFHQYLVGRRFTVLSDHKPLQHLFQESKGVPTLLSSWEPMITPSSINPNWTTAMPTH